MKSYFVAIVIIAFSLNHSAVAVEALSASELASHCEEYPTNTDSLDGEFCARYIQGFIDGAVSTDARVMLNVEADYNKKASFTERALRARAPSREEYLRAAKYAEFCLGDPVPLQEVVSHIVEELTVSDNISSSVLARDVVYDVLQKHYPCAVE